MSLKHLLVLVAGSILLSVTMIRSGSLYSYGFGYWGPNGHDAIWHLAVIEQSRLAIPPQNPIFSGAELTNYHWGYDLFASFISSLTALNVQTIYFKIIPFLTAFFYGLFAYLFFFELTRNKIGALIFIGLNFFAGSLGWLITLFQNGSLGGESLFWSMQGASTLINPPFALSLVFLFLGLWLTLKKFNPFLVGAIFGLLALIKIYSAILFGLSLFLYLIVDIKNKTYYLRLFGAFSLLTIIVALFLGYLNSGSLVVWQPFWFVHSLIESTDKLYWPSLASYRQSLSQNLSLIKLPLFIIIETFLAVVFLLGNFGTRVFGVFSIKTKLEISLILKTIIFLSILFPLFFIQKGTAWNTIQFLYYGLIFSNIYFAIFLSKLIQTKRLAIFSILFLVTALTSLGTLKDYFGNPPPSSLPIAEIQALSFLKHQPSGIVLSYPYDPYLKSGLTTPIPLYLYETTAYVSAFSGKVSFLADEMNADILGLNWRSRRKDITDFFLTKDKFFARGFLLNNRIDYIYLLSGQHLPLSLVELEIDQIYNQSGITIYRVRR
ncbi:MAG: hypothetical protein WCV93_02135 [Candidatus Shapirobacteria bacterium]|jgi:hypothetical protein